MCSYGTIHLPPLNWKPAMQETLGDEWTLTSSRKNVNDVWIAEIRVPSNVV